MNGQDAIVCLGQHSGDGTARESMSVAGEKFKCAGTVAGARTVAGALELTGRVTTS